MTNTDLAERIEALDGSERTYEWIDETRLFDGRIEFALHGKEGRLHLDLRCGGLVARNDCPHYTTSLDAAMTLVPEGMMFTVSLHDHGQGAASIFKRDANGSRETACKLCVAATPALALCAAALRATPINGASE